MLNIIVVIVTLILANIFVTRNIL